MNGAKLFGSMLALAVVLMMGAAPGQAAITGTSGQFATNYSVGSGNYSKGGATLTFSITVSSTAQSPAALGSGSNVSVEIYNATEDLYTTIYLTNQTDSGNGTWNGTWTAVSSDWAATGFLYFSVNDSSGESNTNITSFGIDATSPTGSSLTVGGTSGDFTWKGRTGQSKNVTVTIADSVEVGSATLDFTSVPSGSALTDTSMTCSGAGTTSATCNYTFTPDVLGTYTFRVTSYDGVTNSHNTASVNVGFTLRDSDYVLPSRGATTTSPSVSGDAASQSQRPFSLVPESNNPISTVLDGFARIPEMIMSVFQPILNLFGIQ